MKQAWVLTYRLGTYPGKKDKFAETFGECSYPSLFEGKAEARRELVRIGERLSKKYKNPAVVVRTAELPLVGSHQGCQTWVLPFTVRLSDSAWVRFELSRQSIKGTTKEKERNGNRRKSDS